MFDLVLKGGRVIDPAQGVDARMDVAFADGQGGGDRTGPRRRASRRAMCPA